MPLGDQPGGGGAVVGLQIFDQPVVLGAALCEGNIVAAGRQRWASADCDTCRWVAELSAALSRLDEVAKAGR